MLEDVVEADQHRRVDAALAAGRSTTSCRSICSPGSLVGHDGDVAVGVDADVPLAPVGNAVELGGVVGGPLAVKKLAAGSCNRCHLGLATLWSVMRENHPPVGPAACPSSGSPSLGGAAAPGPDHTPGTRPPRRGS